MENMKYIYHLPFLERLEFCKIMNQNDKWEALAGAMQYDVLTIQNLRKEKNPTDELLTLWGNLNHTITELFVLLSRIQHYQAMKQLLPFVDRKFHRLLHNGEANLQHVARTQAVNKNTKDLKIGTQNFNQCALPQQSVNKVLNQMAQLGISPSNSNNLLVASLAAAAAVFSPSPQNTGSNEKKINESPLPRTESTLPQASYSELAIATDGWNQHNVLGRGGFGTVYRGIWKNTDVAIKKIRQKGSDSDESYKLQLQQSLKEIKILNSRTHENILPLYAYSLGGEAPCLVYQLMKNGSLEDRLLLRQKTKPLLWLQRHDIAKGIARGLQYLHTIGEKPLIHGDIKSANILLDKNFEPRIGDFGLAREGPDRDSMKISRIHGTRPYLPDEFLRDKKLSTKIDSYSYGIVLFEMATGLRAYDDSRPENKLLVHLIESSKNNLSLLIDKKGGEYNKEVSTNLLSIGMWCANEFAQNRPTMEIVFETLNNL
ncbi:PREDICTED: serine/threonine-protein kinase pelle [Vollenhovia emeryi]|uniref:serine/threonine-protein kinase pelle n=1 Tax=Vollenhovia emeryi TaxID=411798 RepID=UPI0005F580E7|nr:PREDICTED: serine/threonine-protein kinase pelle [Vollenhovia emeryi]XP_011870814.1 PREDICTED: serine/threonine-protein kinase pelle [Vollenhovia emeryi]XP_011870815.1 PREDICTED: serine/threonine-protein kinase pelle [Vollenhovia emeryi]XP_011870816.1 PREDICTED: serine/threonine-protein kinase pelle [Vollenhovia emeryi]